MHLKKWASFGSVSIAAYASTDFNLTAKEESEISLEANAGGHITLMYFLLKFKVDGLVDEVAIVFGAMAKKFDVRYVPVNFAEMDIGKFLIGHTLQFCIRYWLQ